MIIQIKISHSELTSYGYIYIFILYIYKYLYIYIYIYIYIKIYIYIFFSCAHGCKYSRARDGTCATTINQAAAVKTPDP